MLYAEIAVFVTIFMKIFIFTIFIWLPALSFLGIFFYKYDVNVKL